MSNINKAVRVAVVQAAPVIMDLDATVVKTIVQIYFLDLKEDILIADLQLDQIIQSRLDFDVNGHYSRPDVFKLSVQQ